MSDAAVQVYFIRPMGADGPVKIGCSKNPAGRLHACRAGSPVPLEMVGTVDGALAIEWALHARFEHLHLHHEWFRVDAELARLLNDVREGRFDPTALPKPRRLAYAAGGRKDRPVEAKREARA